MAMILTNNSPSAGYVAWSGVIMTLKSVDYNVVNGNSNKKYIWWDFTNPNAFQVSDTLPIITNDDCVFLLNIAGVYYLIPGRTIYQGELFSASNIEAIMTFLATPKTDAIAENTAGAGVTIDGTLIKDGGATLNTPVITGPIGIVKADVGLGNVDNTSDAIKNAAAVTLTNKTITDPAGMDKIDVGLTNVDNTSDATKLAATLLAVYPIGCIYTTIVATNPATVFGFGTWVAFGAGKVLVGLNAAETEFDTVQETGGAKIPTTSDPSESAGGQVVSGGGYVYNHTHTVSVLQPYIVVYFFKRTA